MAEQFANMNNAEDSLKLYLEDVRAAIEMGKVEQALDILKRVDKATEAGIGNDITMLTGNYKEAKEMFESDLIDVKDFKQTSAKVKARLLDIMDQLPRRIELNVRIKGLTTFQYKVLNKDNFEKVLAGHDNLYRINWLEEALKYSKAVCRVVCGAELGTGFLTKEGYVFTNNHVIKDAAAAAGTKLEFNYRIGSDGKVAAKTVYELDATDFFTSDEAQLDFTRVKVKDRADAPLKNWGFVDFDSESVPVIGDAVTIIQHPGGEDMQIALDSNDVISLWNQYVFYTSPTLPGSSGSPVFNKDWKVVALHHAGFGDTVINAQGEHRGANRGILFRDIFKHLRDQGQPVPA